MTTTTTAARARLERPRSVVLSGVSVAVARHLGLSIAGVRIGFLALTLIAGAGALLYLWLWALTPLERSRADLAGVTRAVPVAIIFLTFSVLTAVLAVTFHLTGFFRGPLIPGMIESAIFAALCVWWTLAVDRVDPLWRPAGPAIRLSAAVVLEVEGALLLLQQWRPAVAVVAVFLIIMGVGILIIPRVVTLWTELGGERAARVREEQRAEIAAHLHDSVLQTLALIQNRAGAQSEVARIARAQERELRDWLFAGTDPFAQDLAAELRSFGAELELEYAVRIEVITAGEVAGIASASLSGAAREAMLNAARHAGGEVTVFVEATPGAIDVFVRDHGPGFDADEVPDGRLGVRESIIGRMARAGGAATVTSDETGTEVQLHLERGARS
jgi:signal transduction histidine kinase